MKMYKCSFHANAVEGAWCSDPPAPLRITVEKLRAGGEEELQAKPKDVSNLRGVLKPLWHPSLLSADEDGRDLKRNHFLTSR